MHCTLFPFFLILLYFDKFLFFQNGKFLNGFKTNFHIYLNKIPFSNYLKIPLDRLRQSLEITKVSHNAASTKTKPTSF